MNQQERRHKKGAGEPVRLRPALFPMTASVKPTRSMRSLPSSFRLRFFPVAPTAASAALAVARPAPAASFDRQNVSVVTPFESSTVR
jgi:hypothetical protein